jgi:hypothetical protein
VLIDSKAGGGAGGNMFYLPLDKLLDKAAREPEVSATPQENTGSGQREPESSVTVEARGRGER